MKNKVRKILMIFSCLIGLSFTLSAQNPYLPLWEFIPDGEPYVFEDPDCPGKYRLYIYGSHDNLKWMYCGRDQVVWSAPVEDLTRWRYDGVIFKVNESPELYKLNADGTDDVLFAPDVTVTTDADGKKTYYLFPNNQGGGRNSMIAKSDRPVARLRYATGIRSVLARLSVVWDSTPQCLSMMMDVCMVIGDLAFRMARSWTLLPCAR